MINQKTILANEILMENKIGTIIDVPQWKSNRDRGQVSEENLY